MPRKAKTETDGHLQEAVAVLINNQAQFLGVAARIETELAQIRSILLRHEQILNGLPEAIREKIGFAPRK